MFYLDNCADQRQMVSDPENKSISIPNRQVNFKRFKYLGGSASRDKNRPECINGVTGIYRLVLVIYRIYC
jgi:hypothetical protein